MSHHFGRESTGEIQREPPPPPTINAPHEIQQHSSGSHRRYADTDTQIVRQIINHEKLKIPRRANEGLRPIFDREELGDSIKLRMGRDNNEQNPINSEQRVVAIIREPVTLVPQFIQPNFIPIIHPSQFLSHSMVQPPAPQGKFEMPGGICYSHSKDQSRSRSSARGRRQSSPDRLRERHGSPRHHMEDIRNQHRLSLGPNENRSPSSVRVEQVRSVSATSSSLYADITPNHYYEERLEGSRNYPWNDLRKCINSRQQFVPGYTDVCFNSGVNGPPPDPICTYCINTGHGSDDCVVRKKDIALVKSRALAKCAYCRRENHTTELSIQEQNPC